MIHGRKLVREEQVEKEEVGTGDDVGQKSEVRSRGTSSSRVRDLGFRVRVLGASDSMPAEICIWTGYIVREGQTHLRKSHVRW